MFPFQLTQERRKEGRGLGSKRFEAAGKHSYPLTNATKSHMPSYMYPAWNVNVVTAANVASPSTPEATFPSESREPRVQRLDRPDPMPQRPSREARVRGAEGQVRGAEIQHGVEEEVVLNWSVSSANALFLHARFSPNKRKERERISHPPHAPSARRLSRSPRPRSAEAVCRRAESVGKNSCPPSRTSSSPANRWRRHSAAKCPGFPPVIIIPESSAPQLILSLRPGATHLSFPALAPDPSNLFSGPAHSHRIPIRRHPSHSDLVSEHFTLQVCTPVETWCAPFSGPEYVHEPPPPPCWWWRR